jgi:hypothetical protein
MRKLMIASLMGVVAVAACSGDDAAPDPDPDRLGEIVVRDQTACEPGIMCHELTVTCPGVVAPADVTLFAGEPATTDLGTVLFATGDGGMNRWSREGPPGREMLGELRAAGYRVVEIAWAGRWFEGSSIDEGPAVLACRVATVVDWAFDNLHAGPGFCAVGTSGGSAQVTYLLTDYGLDTILDLVIPIEGPPFARIDQGCLPRPGEPADLAYGVGVQRTGRFDASFGFADGDGPCTLQDETFRARFENASLGFGPRDYDHPTRVRMVFGDVGNANAQAQGSVYLDRLMTSATDVTVMTVPGDHGLAATDPGADAIRDLVIEGCVPVAR